MESIEKKTRKVGRPRKDEPRVEDTSTRPTRNRTGGWKQKIPVKWTDPNYFYRWAFAPEADSFRIMELRDQGYEFASAEEHSFGDSHVYKTGEGGSSVVRCPAGKQGGYLYLMRIRKEWYLEDQEDKRKKILDTEKDSVRQYHSQEGDGVYGKVKIDHGLK